MKTPLINVVCVGLLSKLLNIYDVNQYDGIWKKIEQKDFLLNGFACSLWNGGGWGGMDGGGEVHGGRLDHGGEVCHGVVGYGGPWGQRHWGGNMGGGSHLVEMQLYCSFI